MASYFAPIYTRALDDSDYEPNNDLANAAVITTGVHTGLTLSSSTDEDDWFKIELSEGMAISVDMEVTDSDDGNYFYIRLTNENESFLDSDYFSYYTDNEYGDNSGNVSYYADDSTLMVYIQCHYSFWNTNDATYTLRINIFDPKGDAKFSYGIETGEDLIYTASNNIDLQASSNFYNEVGGYIVDQIEDDAGEDVFSNSFNFSHFMGDLLDFFSMDVDLKFSISDIYNLDLQQNNRSTDVIEGSIMMGNNDNWVLPSAYMAGKLEELNSTFEPYFDPDFYDNFQPILNDSITELNDVEATDFEDLPLSVHTYFENVTDAIGISVDPLDDGTEFPAFPNEHYLPISPSIFGFYSIFSLFSNVELCYPTDFSFLDWYNWGLDVYNFSAQYAEQEGEDIPVFEHSIQDLFAIGGISSFHVDKQSIGFVWSLNGIDFDALEDILNYTDGDLEDDLTTELANQGIDYNNSGISVSFAVEYNSDMVLASYAQYVDMTIAFENTSITDFNIDGETVRFSISQTLVREGYEAPTSEQIQDGELGENRDLGGGGFFSNIPGAPIEMISFASLVSLIALVYLIKRRK